MHKVLLVDDDSSILKALHRLLRTLDIDLYTANCPDDALILCGEHQFKLIISDQRMPNMDGTELLEKVKDLQPESTRMILSAYSDFDAITESFNRKTIHKFIAKPWDNDKLRFVVKAVIQADQHQVESKQVDTLGLVDFHGIYTQCDEMLNLFDMIKRVATANVPVNIYGPTGTGKELIANALHQESPRHDKKMLAINCANLTPELAESQLFGHKKGAFTGASSDSDGLLAAANGGSLFLDEVTCLPLPVQVKLLRALQEQEYYRMGTTQTIPFDVQVISASSTSLKQAVESEGFRADLRFRLEVIPLLVPALKDRGEDGLEIFKLFIKQLRPTQTPSISKETEVCIRNYPWPGNVRELFNAASYAHAILDGNTITPEYLPKDIQLSTQAQSAAPVNKATPAAPLEKEHIDEALKKHRGNRSKTASSLGISRMTLWRRMKQLNM